MTATQRLAVWQSRFDGLQMIADGRAPLRMLGDATVRFTAGLQVAAAREEALAEGITWADSDPDPESDSDDVPLRFRLLLAIVSQVMVRWRSGASLGNTADLFNRGRDASTAFDRLFSGSAPAPPRWRSPPARSPACAKPRHRHQEFPGLSPHLARGYPDQQLHLITDNYAAHKQPKVKAWLAANPRIHIHFTPTSGSSLNLVEIWFGDHQARGRRRRCRGGWHSVR